MLLLCLTDQDPADALHSLDLLSHEVRVSPLAVRVTESAASRFDAIIVDATRDPRRGRTACLDLKQSTQTPRLVVLTESALTALTPEWGASDFLLPTACPAEIELRLRLAGSTGSAAHESTPTAVRVAGVTVDESNFTAKVQGRTLDLTYKEFELMYFLAANPGRVFTREQLLSEVWGTDYFGGTRTVDVHVRRLRAKLGDHEALISTVRGVGYGFARAREETDESEEE